MIISGKDVPKQFASAWNLGIVTCSICFINIFLFVVSGNMLPLVSAIISLASSIAIFLIVSKQTKRMIWDRLANG